MLNLFITTKRNTTNKENIFYSFIINLLKQKGKKDLLPIN
jgi:hypothetical protein